MNDVIDVNNESDYKVMVKKILPRNPGTTKTCVDMKHIEKPPSVDDSEAGNSGESSEGDNVRRERVHYYHFLFLIAC